MSRLVSIDREVVAATLSLHTRVYQAILEHCRVGCRKCSSPFRSGSQSGPSDLQSIELYKSIEFVAIKYVRLAFLSQVYLTIIQIMKVLLPAAH